MTTYDQQNQQVENQTNVAGNVIGVDIGDVTGDINRAVITRRDVIQSILITGDHNQVFIGNYQPLGKVYKEPWEVFERTSRLPFTGREWLLSEVDNFLNKEERGYFILEAGAGLGKTAFLAWLVKERGYIHHFCELTPGAEGVGEGLKNLAAQLALAYKLEPDGVLLAEVASHPSYLSDLLRRVADKRDENEKIVVVVDALDESHGLGNQNVMGLPATLPEGVYFIVSQRPSAATLNVKDPTITARQYLRFSAEDEDNQADMRRLLVYASGLPEIIHVFQAGEHKYTSEQFVSTLMDKCRGVWIYLYYVVQEIRKGDRSPLDLAALPYGMAQYYAQYWRRWRDEDEEKWDELYLPVLTTFAAAQESLSLQRLIEWSGAAITERSLRRLLEGQWRPFLTIAKQGTEHRYRFYHATLQEFCHGQLSQDNLSLNEIELVEELAEATRMCHHRLAERYLEAWDGWVDDLRGLKDEQRRDMDGRYGLRHLVAHLKASDRIDDIHRLLRVEWVYSEQTFVSAAERDDNEQVPVQRQENHNKRYQNAWYTVRETVGQTDGYLADVTLAWQLTQALSASETDVETVAQMVETEQSWQNKDIGLQCRYALIISSLNSIAHNIEPGLLVELIKKNIWHPAQGLAYARQVPDPRQRTEMLVALAPLLTDKAKQERVLKEVLGVACAIESRSSRAYALVSLAPHLTQTRRGWVIEEVLGVARSIGDSYSREIVLATLAPHLSTQYLKEAVAVACSIDDSYSLARVLATFVPYLPHTLQAQVIEELLVIAPFIDDRYSKGKVLIALAPYLEELGRVEEALHVARSIHDSSLRARVLATLAPYLSQKQQEQVIQEALEAARSIDDASRRADALATLAPLLSQAAQQQVLNEALEVLCSISFFILVEPLATLAPHLSSKQLEDALVVARSLYSSNERANALATLAPYVSQTKQRQVLEEALMSARSIDDSDYRVKALAIFATHLSQTVRELILEEALKAVRYIDSHLRNEILTTLTPRLLPQQFEEALAVARSIYDSKYRVQALADLAPHLPQTMQERVIEETLTLARCIDEGYSHFQVSALAILVPHLSKIGHEWVLEEMLALARSIDYSEDRVEALVTLVPHLPQTMKERVIEETLVRACDIDDEYHRVEALATIIPHLCLNQIEEALAVAHSIDSEYNRIEILATLALHIAELGQFESALVVARSVADSDDRAKILVNFAPYLSSQQIKAVLAVARSIYFNYDRAMALATLAPYLPQTTQKQVFGEVLVLARSIDDSEDRARVLAILAPHLPQSERANMLGAELEMAHSINDSSSRARVLAILTPHLSQTVQENVLEAALAVARSINNNYDRADALTTLAFHLAKLPKNKLYILWRETLPILSGHTRANLLADLSALDMVIAQLGGADAISETVQAIEDVGRWWP